MTDNMTMTKAEKRAAKWKADYEVDKARREARREAKWAANPHSVFPYKKLPLEIRLKVIEMLLTFASAAKRETRRTDMGILLLNKFTFNKLAPAYQQARMFYFDSHYFVNDIFLPYAGDLCLQNTTKMHLSFDNVGCGQIDQEQHKKCRIVKFVNMLETNSKLPKLRVVDIIVHSKPHFRWESDSDETVDMAINLESEDPIQWMSWASTHDAKLLTTYEQNLQADLPGWGFEEYFRMWFQLEGEDEKLVEVRKGGKAPINPELVRIKEMVVRLTKK